MHICEKNKYIINLQKENSIAYKFKHRHDRRFMMNCGFGTKNREIDTRMSSSHIDSVLLFD